MISLAWRVRFDETVDHGPILGAVAVTVVAYRSPARLGAELFDDVPGFDTRWKPLASEGVAAEIP